MSGATSGTIGATFPFEQVSPSMTWIIPHGLGRYVIVAAYDSDGDEVSRDVTYIDKDTVRVTFAIPTAGHAVCS